MSDHTKIEWTDATWGPVTGCTRVSPGCDHCYIERTPPFRIAHRRFDGDGPGSTTDVQLHPERLDQPLRWKKPRRIFVNSMADLFHAEVPDEYIAKVFAVMAVSFEWDRPTHTFQVLTKRPARMRSLLRSDAFRLAVAYEAAQLTDEDHADAVYEKISHSPHHWPLPNVWLGVSAENQKWADIRIPALLDTPAAVRFVSAEPLLGPINFEWLNGGLSALSGEWTASSGSPHPLLDWVIVGGESGPGARPMSPDWVRDIRDQCDAAGVAFHFKQYGDATLWRDQRGDVWTLGRDGLMHTPETAPFTREHVEAKWGPLIPVRKRQAGRELDGRTYDGYPTAATNA